MSAVNYPLTKGVLLSILEQYDQLLHLADVDTSMTYLLACHRYHIGGRFLAAGVYFFRTRPGGYLFYLHAVCNIPSYNCNKKPPQCDDSTTSSVSIKTINHDSNVIAIKPSPYRYRNSRNRTDTEPLFPHHKIASLIVVKVDD